MIVKCSGCLNSNRLPASRLKEKASCAACREALLPSGRTLELASAEDFDELVRDAPMRVLVDFSADWCGPCQMVGPELEKIASKHRGTLIVAKVDTEALPDVARRFKVRSIPLMVVFDGGRETKRVAGAMHAAAIEERLGLGGDAGAGVSARP
jgi:thioredoxin 2